MYINKVVFLEGYDVLDLNEEFPNLIVDTDYGTTELLGDRIQEASEDFEAFKREYGINEGVEYKDFMEKVSNRIGTDLYEMLENGSVDFCLIC